MSRSDDPPPPWAEAIALADQTGDLSGIVDLFFDPRVTEVDRAGLGDLFARKVLRDLTPSKLRRLRVRSAYAEARASGLSATEAEEAVATRLHLAVATVVNDIRRGKPLRRTRRCAGPEDEAR